MPLGDLVPIARQIALGLESAHENGIVHRDLKPANIKITEAGVVKVLDFGVAKLRGDAIATADDGRTMTVSGTLDGTIVGTVAYMSPEQARGKAVDKRADVWAFGCILYEMLTGRRPFRGETVSDTIAATLDQSPDWSLLPAATPPSLRRLLSRCLEKDPAHRLRDVGDAIFDLDESLRESRAAAAPVPAASRAGRRRILVLALGALVVAVAAAIGWSVRSTTDILAPAAPVALTSLRGNEQGPSFSPDGRYMAFEWNGLNRDNRDIYVLVVGSSATPQRLTTDVADDSSPSWSPDGAQIAFVRRGLDRATIYTVSPLGGSERKVAEFPSSATTGGLSKPSWSRDSRSLVIGQSALNFGTGITLVSADGVSPPRPIVPASPDARIGSPVLSPADDSLAYSSCRVGQTCTLVVQPLDAALTPTGSPRSVTTSRLLIFQLTWATDGQSLIYVESQGLTLFNPSSLWRVPASGGAPPVRLDAAGNAWTPAVSSHRLAYARRQGDADIWRLAPGGDPVTFPASSSFSDVGPSMSSDGKRVAFATDRDGGMNEIWVSNIDGTGLRPLARGANQPVDHGSPRWSPDDKRIAFDGRGSDGVQHVFVVDAEGGLARQLDSGSQPGQRPAWSADGKWIYFNSSREGVPQIHRIPAAGGSSEQVTQKGGAAPVVSLDGTTLYYFRPTDEGRTLFAAPIAGGPERPIDRIVSWNYCAVETGLVYMTAAGDSRNVFEVRLLDASSGRIQTLYTWQADGMGYGLGATRDAKTVLVSGSKNLESDLWMIENYR
jgi:Tol biopolymer transport system component